MKGKEYGRKKNICGIWRSGRFGKDVGVRSGKIQTGDKSKALQCLLEFTAIDGDWELLLNQIRWIRGAPDEGWNQKKHKAEKGEWYDLLILTKRSETSTLGSFLIYWVMYYS